MPRIGTKLDLAKARTLAKKALLEDESHRHVVYGYSNGNDNEISVFGWYDMPIFTSDEAFNIWLDDYSAAGTIYALHA